MRIANIINDSIVDGHGLRYTIFVQGCNKNCPGCHNPGTHDINGGTEIPMKQVIDMLTKALNNPMIEGLTISGGEPFLNPVACRELATITHNMGKNVWVYTGYRYEDLLAMNDKFINAFIEEINVLVDGPFVESEKSYELHFRGSRNQRLIDVPNSLRSGGVVEWVEEDPLAKFTIPES